MPNKNAKIGHQRICCPSYLRCQSKLSVTSMHAEDVHVNSYFQHTKTCTEQHILVPAWSTDKHPISVNHRPRALNFNRLGLVRLRLTHWVRIRTSQNNLIRRFQCIFGIGSMHKEGVHVKNYFKCKNELNISRYIK